MKLSCLKNTNKYENREGFILADRQSFYMKEFVTD